VPRVWRGHAYLLSQPPARVLTGNTVVLVGDAAGLAYPQSGEGIRPAVESGVIAADMIAGSGGRLGAGDLEAYAARVTRRFGATAWTGRLGRLVPQCVARAAAAWLLGTPWFARRILLERWFLHRAEPTLPLSSR